jgi:N-acetylglucosamine kinase-like BadF-type ATPase
MTNRLIVVADSGSSKTDWVVIHQNGEHVDKIRTIGFNPYFQSSELIFAEVEEGFAHLENVLDQVAEVHFYGAGCSSVEKNEIVAKALQPIFKNALIKINHDLEAAAVATLGDQRGIACIIGTGSNSCVWENNKVIDNVPSHGYIFGDEASGSYLGKELVRRYLMDQLDKNLSHSFEETFKLSKEQILNATYREPSPNVFLAKFAKFYSQHPNNPTLNAIIEEGFMKFFEVRIKPYADYASYPLGFVGSIAFYFRPILEKVVQKHDMQIAKITQCPIDELVAYHARKTITV